jgi:hypothetical protein
MPMIFFYFLKIIFDISTSKRSKKYKPHSILVKKKFRNLTKHRYKRNAKHCQKKKKKKKKRGTGPARLIGLLLSVKCSPFFFKKKKEFRG